MQDTNRLTRSSGLIDHTSCELSSKLAAYFFNRTYFFVFNDPRVPSATFVRNAANAVIFKVLQASLMQVPKPLNLNFSFFGLLLHEALGTRGSVAILRGGLGGPWPSTLLAGLIFGHGAGASNSNALGRWIFSAPSSSVRLWWRHPVQSTMATDTTFSQNWLPAKAATWETKTLSLHISNTPPSEKKFSLVHMAQIMTIFLPQANSLMNMLNLFEHQFRLYKACTKM